MRHRHRWATILFGLGWLGTLVMALRVGATDLGVTPESLLTLILASYLGTWGLVFFLSRQGRKMDAARFLACTGSILLVVALLEVPTALGLVDYRVVFTTPTPSWQRPGYRPDPELVFVREGNRHARWSCRGSELYSLRGVPAPATYHCDLRLDGDGFRNPPGQDFPDIAIIGDSFIEGVHVAEPELISSQLGRLTGRTVANLGRSGYGPQQELTVLRRFALAAAPGPSSGPSTRGTTSRTSMNTNRIKGKSRGFSMITVRNRSRAAGSCANALGFTIRTWLRPEPRRPVRQFTGWFVDRAGRQVPIYFGSGVQHGEGAPTPPRESAPELQLVRSLLAEANASCRQNGSKLVVLFIPSRFRVYRDVCTFEPGSPCRSWPVDDLPPALASMVAAVSPDVAFLDLTPRFQADARDGELLYLPDDMHWSAEGHRRAAETLAAFLRSDPILLHRPRSLRWPVENPELAEALLLRPNPACQDRQGGIGVRGEIGVSCRVGKGRPAGSIEPRVSPSPSKIPYGGFSPVRLQMDRQWRPSATSQGLSAVHIRPTTPSYTPPQLQFPGVRDPRRDDPF